MKTILLTILFTFGMVFIYSNVGASSTSCTSQHHCNGCTFNFTQTSEEWHYTLDCGGEIYSYDGDGNYEGTFCGGEEPCSLPEAN